MRPSRLALVGCTIGLAACASPAAEAPSRVVQRFYAARLRALLAAARRVRDADARRAPDEKPAFAEGDLFSSLFEGPSTFAVDSTAAADGRVRVRLVRTGQSTPVAWEDRAVVRQEGGRWVVADIEYGGTWDLANRGTLRTSLERAIQVERP